MAAQEGDTCADEYAKFYKFCWHLFKDAEHFMGLATGLVRHASSLAPASTCACCRCLPLPPSSSLTPAGRRAGGAPASC